MDGSNIRRVVIALLLQKSQILLCFLEVHFDCPSHRIKLQNTLRRKTEIRCQKCSPIMFTNLRLILLDDAANEQQAHLDIFFALFRDRDVDKPKVRQNLVCMLAKTRKLDIRDWEIANTASQHNLLEIVVRLFYDRLFAEVHRGLINRYERQEENLFVLRGKLDTTRQAKFNSAHPERFYCQKAIVVMFRRPIFTR